MTALFALLPLLGLAVFCVFAFSKLQRQKQQPVHTEPDSVELWRGPQATGHHILRDLSDAGVAAWIEERDYATDTAVIHVEAEALSHVPALLQHLGATRQAESAA